MATVRARTLGLALLLAHLSSAAAALPAICSLDCDCGAGGASQCAMHREAVCRMHPANAHGRAGRRCDCCRTAETQRSPQAHLLSALLGSVYVIPSRFTLADTPATMPGPRVPTDSLPIFFADPLSPPPRS